MNTRFFTGYLPTQASLAYAPATADHAALPRLLFDVVIRDSHGVEFPEKCLVDEPRLIADYQPLLTAGRSVIVQGEQTARPFVERGVTRGHVREVRVQRMEFPNRGGKKPETDEAQSREATKV